MFICNLFSPSIKRFNPKSSRRHQCTDLFIVEKTSSCFVIKQKNDMPIPIVIMYRNDVMVLKDFKFSLALYLLNANKPHQIKKIHVNILEIELKWSILCIIYSLSPGVSYLY